MMEYEHESVGFAGKGHALFKNTEKVLTPLSVSFSPSWLAYQILIGDSIPEDLAKKRHNSSFLCVRLFNRDEWCVPLLPLPNPQLPL